MSLFRLARRPPRILFNEDAQGTKLNEDAQGTNLNEYANDEKTLEAEVLYGDNRNVRPFKFFEIPQKK